MPPTMIILGVVAAQLVPPDLLELVRSGGAALAPFLAFQWWIERQERLREREEHKTVSKDMITSMVKTEATLATMADLFERARGAGP